MTNNAENTNWLLEVTSPKTPVTIDGFNFVITPCSRKGSWACFLDVSLLPNWVDGSQHMAIAALVDSIKQAGLEPRLAPDNRPLPATGGAKRVVGGVMVYANTPKAQFSIKAKVVPND